MTFVGKILVFVITGLRAVFLGISTVVFTTAKNWKDATEGKGKVQKLQGETTGLKSDDCGLREGQARGGDRAQDGDQAAGGQGRAAPGRHRSGPG